MGGREASAGPMARELTRVAVAGGIKAGAVVKVRAKPLGSLAFESITALASYKVSGDQNNL